MLMHEAGETGTEGGRQIEGDVFGRCCCEWPRTDCRDVLDADARRSWLAALVAQPRSPGPLAPRATASFTFQPSGRHVVCAQPASEVEVRISRLDPLLQPLCNPREEQDGASIPGRDRARRGRDAPQGYDLNLTQYDDRGWRATFYTTGKEHSPASATGTG